MSKRVNLNDPDSLRVEFEAEALGFNSLHDDMQTYLDGYKYNFFYAPRSHMSQNNRVGVNLVQVFADKLWDHTGEFPKISVPSSPENAQNADKREKYIFSEYAKNNMELLWLKLTFDGGIMGAAVSEVVWDNAKKCNTIRRLDPRYCYWKKADSNSEEVEVFWHAVPMARSAIILKYGINPKGGEGMVYPNLVSGEVKVDNEDYFLVITRSDAKSRVTWVGKDFIQKPFNHQYGVLPQDIAMPVQIADFDHQPFFYLSKLKDLQAEFNENWRRRSNIVRKLGNPLVWGRGIYKQNEQAIKQQLSMDGGFVPLKENGELNLLTIPETAMIDNALNDLFQRMKDAAGFPTATFGESVGANTSGDALGMYFTPTQKMINKHNVAWKSMLKGINAKILRNLENFALLGEQVPINGYMPHSTVRTAQDGSLMRNQRGMGYSEFVTSDIVEQNYNTTVTPPTVTPKDDIAYKRLMLEMARDSVLSRGYVYDDIGIESPEDEFARLENEQQSPFIGSNALEMAKSQAGTIMDDTTGQPATPDQLPQMPAGY